MELHLENRVVAITGGASGIGRACALRYLEEGCRVAVCGRSRDKLERFRADCRDRGFDDVLCSIVDVGQEAELERFVDEVVRTFGAVDIWYNNAGIGVRKPLLEVSLEEWDLLMRVNLRAVFAGSTFAARRMIRQQGGGVIVNAASFTSRIPAAGNGPYSVSKWGVSGLTQVLAGELAPHGIRVFSYTPGLIETELTRDRIAGSRETLNRQVALNRIGTPDDLAPILVMLTSGLAGYFTGVTVEISGGKFCVQNPGYAWDMGHGAGPVAGGVSGAQHDPHRS